MIDPTMTPKKARALGLTTYYTGIPCKHGHLSVRYAGSGNCKSCTIIDTQRSRGVRALPPVSPDVAAQIVQARHCCDYVISEEVLFAEFLCWVRWPLIPREWFFDRRDAGYVLVHRDDIDKLRRYERS